MTKPVFSNQVLFIFIGLVWGAHFAGMASFATAQQKSQNVSVRYVLSFENAANHYVNVKATFSAGKKPRLELFLPVWTPGSYLVREYARNIESIEAADETGRKLAIRKFRKNRWAVDCTNAQKVIVSYRVYCREMSVRTNWVEDSFAILNGAPTFLTATDVLDRPHWVEIRMRKNWKTVSTALGRVKGASPRFVAADFDQLVDSPILVGNQHVIRFQVGGVPHELVNLGGDGLWDFDKAQKDVAKIVAEHQKLWGFIPYKEYKFLNLIVETGGGLEHDNSTLMMTSRWSFGQRGKYLGWLGLVSHEFYHTWNIRRLRPRALMEYDYENENYFNTLWIAEGITSYYDDLMVRRAKLSSEREYLAQLSKSITTLQRTEGRRVQSLSDSSRDTWIKFYRPDENSSNSQISYYTKGAVAAFLLDAEIRNATGGKKSLDDLMRLLYQKYIDEGYTSEQFRQLASSVAGKDMSQFFRKVIDSTAELDYSTALKTYGLVFRKSTTTKGNQPVWLGVKLKSQSGLITVESLTRNSPAFKAGLNVDDEILAIDGYRLKSADVSGILKLIKPGQEKECLYVRRGKVRSLKIKFDARPSGVWSLVRVAKPTSDQVRQYNAWIGVQTKTK